MKFIEINGRSINLDLVTDWFEHDHLLFFNYSHDHASMVSDTTPGYASLKAYLLNLCVARFDAESDAALHPTHEFKEGMQVKIKDGSHNHIGIVQAPNVLTTLIGVVWDEKALQFLSASELVVIPSDVQETVNHET